MHNRAVHTAMVLWLALMPGSGESASAGTSDQDLLILEVRLGSLTLSDGLVAYLHPGGVLLPLGEIAAVLEFPIAVEPEAGVAEGWFLAENRRFSLDLSRREVVVEGVRSTVGTGLAELHSGELYVDSALLERWFPVAFDLDLSRLRLTVRPRETLPVEQRLERRAKWSQLQRSRRSAHHRYPALDLPYRLLAWPAIDHRLALSWNGGAGDAAVRYDAIAAGDLLGMSTELALNLSSGNSESASGLRLKMGRRDAGGNLLGPLRATEASFGDLFSPRRPLVSRQQTGRGFEISNFPLGRPNEFDRTIVRGDALPGWEVELYHNETLIDFQTVADDGRYQFTDVPLHFGFNVLRRILYGPQGQKREHVERLFIGPELIRAGDSYYRLAVHQDAGDSAASGAGRSGARRYFLDYERGLRRNLSIAAGLTSLSLDDGRHTYVSLGLRGTRGGFFASTDLVADSRGGWAGRLAAQGRLLGLQLQLEHEELSDFLSEETANAADPSTRRSSLRIDGRSRNRRLPRLTYRLAAAHEQRRSGASRDSASARLGASFKSWALSNTLSLERQERGLAEAEGSGQLHGSLLATRRRRALRLRGQLQYALSPRRRWTAATLSANWRLRRDFNARLSIRQSLAEELTDTYTTGLTRRYQSFALSVNGGYDGHSGVRANLSLSCSLSRAPGSRRWRAHSRSLTTQGAAAARVFLDRNADGLFDPEDRPHEGVKLTSGTGSRSETDAGGIAWLTELPADRHADLDLLIGSLEDPYWMPRRQGVGLVPRPGRIAMFDFPVVSTGEIDGTVRLRRGGELQEVSKVALQLLDPDGRILHETETAFDGFYLFERILPGRYSLRIDPQQAARLHLEVPPERQLTLASGEIVTGLDWVLSAVGSAG